MRVLSSAAYDTLRTTSHGLALGPQVHLIGLDASLGLAWGEKGCGKDVILVLGFGAEERPRLRYPHPKKFKLSQNKVGIRRMKENVGVSGLQFFFGNASTENGIGGS
jgi:hypothetical protein